MADSADCNIGGKLKLARVSSAKTQGQLASALGTSRQAISAMENGHRRISAVELLRICFILDRDITLGADDIIKIIEREKESGNRKD